MNATNARHVERVWGGFGAAAEAYERGRPGWPPAAVDALGLPRDAGVLDLAAGTGKLTRVLVQRFARVYAVEPDPAMRRFVSGALGGDAHAIPLADGSVDAVFIAEAFHWFADRDAVAEIARVLRPGGTLALLWNLPLDDVIPEHIRKTWPSGPPNAPRPGDWRRAFDGSAFGPFEYATFEHAAQLSRDELAAYYASFSWIATLAPDARARELDRFTSLLDRDVYERRMLAELHHTRLA